jgi:hypothetical protein
MVAAPNAPNDTKLVVSSATAMLAGTITGLKITITGVATMSAITEPVSVIVDRKSINPTATTAGDGHRLVLALAVATVVVFVPADGAHVVITDGVCRSTGVRPSPVVPLLSSHGLRCTDFCFPTLKSES